MLDPLRLALNPNEPIIPPLQQLVPRPVRKQPLGAALDWSEDDLDALASISSADILAAVALWQQDAPAGFRDLLDAQVIEADQP